MVSSDLNIKLPHNINNIYGDYANSVFGLLFKGTTSISNIKNNMNQYLYS